MFIIIKLYLIILINIVNVDTNLNNAIFWSGKNGYIISKIYAKKNNKTTLEFKLNQTIIGKQIFNILKNYSNIESKNFWCALSEKYAKYSKGNIEIFISEYNTNSIWYNIERPILLSNRNINFITIYNI